MRTCIGRRSAVLIVTLVSAAALGAQSQAPYRDASRPVDARVADLISRMTLEEKVAQLQGLWQRKTAMQDATGRFLPAGAASLLAHGAPRLRAPHAGARRADDRYLHTGARVDRSPHATRGRARTFRGDGGDQLDNGDDRAARRGGAMTPSPSDTFTFGLWTVGNRGRDPCDAASTPVPRANRVRRRLEPPYP